MIKILKSTNGCALFRPVVLFNSVHSRPGSEKQGCLKPDVPLTRSLYDSNAMQIPFLFDERKRMSGLCKRGFFC